MREDTTALYDGLGPAYDAMVDWDGRLRRESPFFEWLFKEAGARRVLDVGCSTGGHAIHFARLGLEAVGADPSGAMLAQAERKAAGVPGAHFAAAGFGELQAKVGGAFDAVTCLGNTLPHALSRNAVRAALADIGAVLRPEGLLIVQQLNYDRILSQRQRFLGVSAGNDSGREVLFFRFYDFGDELLTFNLVTFRRDDGDWSFRVHSTLLRPILKAELEELLPECGFGPAEFFGDYQSRPFIAGESNDLILVARKG
ncbi:MAG: class I SAM-dependent methyltransferase [Actinobacteria bacterium]|nr:class I SAM-dependent methyltransferase [Actinomycetota bacterium]MCL5025221.1 class I SAM-dependent methyltransferase [Chloroflexota bacterium]